MNKTINKSSTKFIQVLRAGVPVAVNQFGQLGEKGPSFMILPDRTIIVLSDLPGNLKDEELSVYNATVEYLESQGIKYTVMTETTLMAEKFQVFVGGKPVFVDGNLADYAQHIRDLSVNTGPAEIDNRTEDLLGSIFISKELD